MREAELHFTLLPNASDIKVVATLLPIDLEKRKKDHNEKTQTQAITFSISLQQPTYQVPLIIKTNIFYA